MLLPCIASLALHHFGGCSWSELGGRSLVRSRRAASAAEIMLQSSQQLGAAWGPCSLQHKILETGQGLCYVLFPPSPAAAQPWDHVGTGGKWFLTRKVWWCGGKGVGGSSLQDVKG